MSKLIKRIINTTKAPKPVAPYNQAVAIDRTLYVSGVLGLDKNTMTLVPGGVIAETKQALSSLKAILEAGNSSLENVVKVTILLKSIADFNVVNEIYSEFFTSNYPARCAYEVSALPLEAQIEIEAIAICGEIETVVAGGGCSSCGTGPGGCTCKL